MIFGETHHRSDSEPGWETKVPPGDIDDLSVAFCGPDREEMADKPECDPDRPEPEAKSDGCCERAVGDGDRAGRAAEQDRLDQGAVDGRVKARNVCQLPHQISAPPPNEKKPPPW